VARAVDAVYAAVRLMHAIAIEAVAVARRTDDGVEWWAAPACLVASWPG
jgi:hypothetical protein